MRQVNRDELVTALQSGIGDWSTTLLNELQHHDPARRLMARLVAARLLTDKLRRLEDVADEPARPLSAEA
jgi:hypothetical protein